MNYNKELDRVFKSVDSFMQDIFEDIIIDGPDIDFNTFNINPTMFVSTHRSHVDYFLVGYFLYKNGIRNMRFAAGDNLTNFPYIGDKFKKMGAFSIERGKSFNRKYVRDLCARVTSMLLSGENIIVFPESGRSYSGMMLEAKGGMIASQVIAQHKTKKGSHYFFPIAISYEKLPELRWFDLLLKGKELRRSKNILKKTTGDLCYYGSDILAFSKFLCARRFGKKYQKVYIDYGEPFSIEQITDIYANYIKTGRDEMSKNRESIQKISRHIYDIFISLYRLLPSHIVAGILEKKGKVTLKEAALNIPGMLEDLKKKNMNCKTLLSLSPDEIVDRGVKRLKETSGINISGGILSINKISVIKYYTASLKSPEKGVKT